MRRLQLWIYGKRERKRISHTVNLIIIFGVADSCNGMNFIVEHVCGHTAKQIQLVRICHGNKQIGGFYACVIKHGHRRGIAVYAHNIETLGI